jgi:O-antigen/teichoic acid export membrane protein
LIVRAQKLLSNTSVRRVGWTTGAYGVSQGLRLATNVILARLLAPELFGVMVVVNTLRTGIELLSDLGVGQNIVSNKNGDDPDFVDTAWSIQAIRGIILASLFALAAYPVSWFYKNPLLLTVMPMMAIFLLFAGLESTTRFSLQKRLAVKTLSIFEMAAAFGSLIAHVAFALVFPSIWALIYGGIASSAMLLVGSFCLVPGTRHRFMLNRDYARQMLHLGKWIFLSSGVYFLATSFDRLYLAAAFPLAVIGTYGIARQLAEVVSQLMLKIGSMIIFPMVAASDLPRAELRKQLLRVRTRTLFGVAVGVSMFVALSDVIVRTMYDERYHQAALMLPILAAGVWFAILCTVNESVLLGIGRPVHSAVANVTKFIWLLIAIPLGIRFFGIAGAVVAVASADAVRYLPLWRSQKHEHLSFLHQDALITLAMFGMIVLWRIMLWSVGIGTGFHGLWMLLRPWLFGAHL